MSIINSLVAIVLSTNMAFNANTEGYQVNIADLQNEAIETVFIEEEIIIEEEAIEGLIYLKNLMNAEKIENIGSYDWFQQSQHLLKREQDCLIFDIKTEKFFSIRRTYGTNHADVEPLTKEDTDIILSIWDTFSWEHRAVLVITEDSIIAASMTGMPHAGLEDAPALATVDNRSGGFGRGTNLDSVKGNNVDGHFDIHFLNSRTHSTNAINQHHQNKVKEAENYIQTHLK